MSVADSYFEQMFKDSDDPWHFRHRWYEKRKRALTAALLPHPHYRSIFEPGCANGELSALLATRCDQLVCCDTSPMAVDLARQRLQRFSNARVSQRRLPQQWPEGEFELIVLSELCYYLDIGDLQQVVECALASLSGEGVVLACHWRQPIEGCPQTAEQVHQRLHVGLGLTRLVEHREEDFLLDIWSRSGRSVATEEGLR